MLRHYRCSWFYSFPECEEPRASRSLGFLNIAASETSTEDELAAEVKFHNSRGAAPTAHTRAQPHAHAQPHAQAQPEANAQAPTQSQPRLVYHVDNTDATQPTIVVDFRPIDPMPTSPSSIRPKVKSIGISPSRSLPKLSPSDMFVQEARELYSSHFGAKDLDEPINRGSSTEYIHLNHSKLNHYTDKYVLKHGAGSCFSPPHACPVKSAKLERFSPDKDKYKLRPTLQTPPFPTDLTVNRKLSVYSAQTADEQLTDYESVFDGADRPEVVLNVRRPMQRLPPRTVEEQRPAQLPPPVRVQHEPRSFLSSRTVMVNEQDTALSQQSSHSMIGATLPDVPPSTQTVEPPFPAFRPVYVHSHTPQHQMDLDQKKKDFSCCSLGRETHPPLDNQPETLDTSSVPGSPNKRRHSRHYRSNSTPFPSPCNFIDLLADDPTTSRDPYNYYHVTTSQPSLAVNTASSDSSTTRMRSLRTQDGAKVPTSSSAGNLPQGSAPMTELDPEEKSATLGKQPKKGRYIKHKQPSSNQSFGAISGMSSTGYSSSGTTLE